MKSAGRGRGWAGAQVGLGDGSTLLNDAGRCQAWKQENTKQEISIAAHQNSLELTLLEGGVNVDVKQSYSLSGRTCKSPQ